MKGISFPGLSLLYSRTDEEAMCRVKTHDDHGEFDRLVARWERPIRRLCVRMTGDVHRGEDLKQETFVRLFEKRRDYQPTGKFSTFLWRIALNLCYDELRRQNRRHEILTSGDEGDIRDMAEDALTPDARAATSEEGELVRKALMQLPEMYRAVIILRHYEDMKLARIAEVLEIPEGTVNSRMAEALARLSRILEPRLKPLPFSESKPNPIILPKEPCVL
jgi:RNA polymerase sigma factor, sigma-70 family